jgi:hypothetical protein
MTIEVRCKIGTKAYYVSELNNTIIPCYCSGINIYEDGIEYYFDVLNISFDDSDFYDTIFLDYNLACDRLEELRSK